MSEAFVYIYDMSSYCEINTPERLNENSEQSLKDSGILHLSLVYEEIEYSYNKDGCHRLTNPGKPHKYLPMGHSSLNAYHVYNQLKASKYTSGNYSALTNNCIDFVVEMCRELQLKPFPSWLRLHCTNLLSNPLKAPIATINYFANNPSENNPSENNSSGNNSSGSKSW